MLTGTRHMLAATTRSRWVAVSGLGWGMVVADSAAVGVVCTGLAVAEVQTRM